MKFNWVKNLQTLVLVSSALGLTNCSDANLYKGVVNLNSTAGAAFCTTPALAVVTNLKYIFVIDHSGSNQQNYVFNSYLPSPPAAPDTPATYTAAPGTDPTGAKRYGSLISFLQGINDTANTFYASISFSDTTSQPLSWTDANGNRTTSAEAITILQNQMPPKDGGNTDYTDTIVAVQKLIQADITAETEAVSLGAPLVSNDYVIFWISDGAPYVNGVLQDPATITNDVTALMALHTQYPEYVDSINLSTGYYTDGVASLESQVAEQVMSSMATAGQGSFIDFDNNPVINYAQFAIPARTEKYVVRDLWVQNANTVWWNGQLMEDSDSDGIPDVIETQMGSNPNPATGGYDSDGNGVGDGVENFLYGTPCKDPKCNPNNARQFQVQCGQMPAGGYPDPDGDFLNSCEEILLGSNPTDFDSNQDWVPDEFEWLSQVAFTSGTNALNADPMNDGLTNYFKMKENYPVNTSVASVQGYVPMNYQLVQVSDNANQTCYNINIQHLATMSNHDMIRVYVMESRGNNGSVRHMRVANKASSNGNLILSDGDFTP